MWKKWTMRNILNDVRAYKYFSYAGYATGLAFRRFNCPSERMAESKKYFSGK